MGGHEDKGTWGWQESGGREVLCREVKCVHVRTDGRLHWTRFSRGTNPIGVCVYTEVGGVGEDCLKGLDDAIVEA